jgi:hypothetical protein
LGLFLLTIRTGHYVEFCDVTPDNLIELKDNIDGSEQEFYVELAENNLTKDDYGTIKKMLIPENSMHGKCKEYDDIFYLIYNPFRETNSY